MNLLEFLPRSARRRLNIKREVKIWNLSIPYFIEHAVSVPVRDGFDGYFYWNQLVWQEIKMWIQIDEPVTMKDLDYMVARRGFDSSMAAYLAASLQRCGLLRLDLRSGRVTPSKINPAKRTKLSEADAAICADPEPQPA